MNSAENQELLSDPTNSKKTIKTPIVIGVIIILAICLGIGMNYRKKSVAYNEALAKYEQGDYLTAADEFQALGTYKDSSEFINKCYFAEAERLMKSAQYLEAIEWFEQLGEYNDSKEMIILCQNALDYDQAVELFNNKKFKEALVVFENLGDYNDSAAYADICSCTLNAQALEGTEWYYSEEELKVNILKFDKDTAEITKCYFDGNGIHSSEILECDYIATKEELILTVVDTQTEIKIPYSSKKGMIVLEKDSYISPAMVNKLIQGYWTAEESEMTTSAFNKRLFYSKRIFDIHFDNGKVEAMWANTADPATRHAYFYFGPENGTYEITNAQVWFSEQVLNLNARMLFTYMNGELTLYRYTTPLKKSKRHSLPDVDFYDDYFGVN